MNNKQLLELYAQRQELNEALTAVQAKIDIAEKEITATIQSGQEVAGFRLKKGRATRVLQNTDLIRDALLQYGVGEHEMYSMKLLGVPAMLTLIKEGLPPSVSTELASLCVEVREGKPTLEFIGE